MKKNFLLGKKTYLAKQAAYYFDLHFAECYWSIHWQIIE